MKHEAVCQCGALRLEAKSDPDFVVVCNCVQCQRRTGSSFGVGVYFRNDAVSVEGNPSDWTREAPAGGWLTNHFCPTCGTNLFWSLGMRPDHVGVALGCLTTPAPEPSRVIWTSEKHDWVTFPAHWPHYDEATPPG
jgi:hypothetical protein